MNTHPLVSVVLCTYNDEKFIAETIQSVLDQTFHDFEFIIWNDGSTDGTEKVIQSFTDKRIKYFSNENCGVGRAAQLACSHVKGKYIARIDGDDVCLPDRLQKEVDFMETNREYVVVSSSVIYIDESDNHLGRSFPATENDVLQKMLTICDPIVHPACMIRKDAFEKSGGYTRVRQSLDHILFGRIRKFGKIKNLPTPLIKYRLRKGSLSHRIANTQYDAILKNYRDKIISDQDVNERDIEIYNEIFLESRKDNFLQSLSDVNDYKVTLEEKLFKILGGGKISEFIVCNLKNLWCYFKYRDL